MKKIYIFIIIGLILLGCALGFYFYKRNHSEANNNSSLNNFPYNSTRVIATNDFNENSNVSNSSETETSNDISNNTSVNETSNYVPPTETEIASFTTKIYTKDSDRQNNISITCSSLNDTTVENGATFSFCNTVGKATSAKGYKKADVFQDGEKVEALGRSEIAK